MPKKVGSVDAQGKTPFPFGPLGSFPFQALSLQPLTPGDSLLRGDDIDGGHDPTFQVDPATLKVPNLPLVNPYELIRPPQLLTDSAGRVAGFNGGENGPARGDGSHRRTNHHKP
jgi:hypothetical protein